MSLLSYERIKGSVGALRSTVNVRDLVSELETDVVKYSGSFGILVGSPIERRQFNALVSAVRRPRILKRLRPKKITDCISGRTMHSG